MERALAGFLGGCAATLGSPEANGFAGKFRFMDGKPGHAEFVGAMAALHRHDEQGRKHRAAPARGVASIGFI